MKARLTDGQIITVDSPTDFVATEIILEASDVNKMLGMLGMLGSNKQALRAWLLQMKARFPENRLPNIGGIKPSSIREDLQTLSDQLDLLEHLQDRDLIRDIRKKYRIKRAIDS